MNAKQLSIVTAIFVSTLMNGFTFAASSTGSIKTYHLNGLISGRSSCIQTNPVLPTTWVCLYLTNPLHQEIDTLLLNAYLYGKTCTISWSTTDSSGYGKIDWLSCI